MDHWNILKKLLLINIVVQIVFIFFDTVEDIFALILGGLGIIVLIAEWALMIIVLVLTFVLLDRMSKRHWPSIKIIGIILGSFSICQGIIDIPDIFFIIGIWELLMGIYLIVNCLRRPPPVFTNGITIKNIKKSEKTEDIDLNNYRKFKEKGIKVEIDEYGQIRKST